MMHVDSRASTGPWLERPGELDVDNHGWEDA
jgi:hypothetical protein